MGRCLWFCARKDGAFQVPTGDPGHSDTDPAMRVSLPWGPRHPLETLATVAQMRRQQSGSPAIWENIMDQAYGQLKMQ